MEVVLENLTKTFSEDIIAVNNVNLEIPSGQFTVFLGPSGCGKTTTLRMIAGLERQNSGNVFIGDRLVNHLPPKDRNVAMVFQRIALYPSLNVFDNIAFPLMVRKAPQNTIQRRVEQVARLVGIDKLLNRRPSQVSGGEAQRTAIARTMVREPDVLLMDEPLSSLDAKLRVQLRAELKHLHQELQRTTIYVTHDQEEAMTLGDKIVVMNDGIVQQMGTPREIFFKPRNRFVAEFVGTPSMNLFEGQVKREGNRLFFKTEAFRQPLPEQAWSGLETGQIERVLWGIRPDTIKLSSEPGPDFLEGQVDIVELLGTRQLLFINVKEVTFTVMAESSFYLTPADTVYLRFEPTDMYLFDAANGEAIFSPGLEAIKVNETKPVSEPLSG